MNECDAMIAIISFMISEASNEEYINKLVIIREGMIGKKHIEEFLHPRYLSIVFFGTNLFPYSKNDYIEMAKLL